MFCFWTKFLWILCRTQRIGQKGIEEIQRHRFFINDQWDWNSIREGNDQSDCYQTLYPCSVTPFFVRAIYGCALAVPGGLASYFCSWVTRKSWYFSLKSYAGCPGSCRFRAIFRKAQPWLLAWSKGVMRYVYNIYVTSPQAESLVNGLFIFVLVWKKCSNCSPCLVILVALTKL